MPRIPLGPLDTNRVYNRELTPYLRGHINSLKAESHMPEAIGKKINIPPQSVSSTLARLPEQHDGITRKRTGRPLLLSARVSRPGLQCGHIPRHGNSVQRIGTWYQEMSWVSRDIQKRNSVDYTQFCRQS